MRYLLMLLVAMLVLAFPAQSLAASSFFRMFPDQPPLDQQADQQLADLAQTMLDPNADEQNLANTPSGFTYMGQFADHDITLDNTPSPTVPIDPNTLVNARTFAFDLDSVYGGGPDVSPQLYEADGKHFKIQEPNANGVRDLPRNPDGSAILVEGRNDENQIIAQFHIAFLKLHNSLIDDGATFAEAQRTVRWHWQWVLVHDYLPHVAGQDRVDATAIPDTSADRKQERLQRLLDQIQDAADNRRELLQKLRAERRKRHPDRRRIRQLENRIDDIEDRQRDRRDRVRDLRADIADDLFDGHVAQARKRGFYDPGSGEPRTPVEFSSAIFRYGHSQVRLAYELNDTTGKIQVFSFDKPDLRGGQDIQAGRQIDWNEFFEFADDPNGRNQSRAFDTLISKSLFQLPIPGAEAAGSNVLGFRNLIRAKFYGLPSYESVAAAMGITPVGDPVFPEGTPLWFGILRESQITEGGQRLGPVAGRIVAEVFQDIIAVDPTSYVNKKGVPFEPTLDAGDDGKFDTRDLLRAAGVVEDEE